MLNLIFFTNSRFTESHHSQKLRAALNKIWNDLFSIEINSDQQSQVQLDDEIKQLLHWSERESVTNMQNEAYFEEFQKQKFCNSFLVDFVVSSLLKSSLH